jgi:hypothetical protein
MEATMPFVLSLLFVALAVVSAFLQASDNALKKYVVSKI